VFKKVVTYKNFEGETENEELVFNLTVPEIAELEFEFDSGIEEAARKAAASGNNKELFNMFKVLMAISYGRRSEDGKRFLKKKEWLDELFCGLAYEELFLWLFTNEENAIAFFNAIMPERMEERLKEIKAEQEKTGSTSKPKLTELSQEELIALIQKRASGNE
jgi:hypothetical protein